MPNFKQFLKNFCCILERLNLIVEKIALPYLVIR